MILMNEIAQNHFPRKPPGVYAQIWSKIQKNENFSKSHGIGLELVQIVSISCSNFIPCHLVPFWMLIGHLLAIMPKYGHKLRKMEIWSKLYIFDLLLFQLVPGPLLNFVLHHFTPPGVIWTMFSKNMIMIWSRNSCFSVIWFGLGLPVFYYK